VAAVDSPNVSRRNRADARRTLGTRIRSLRHEQGRTLSDVAAAAGISVSLLSQVERGVTDPSLDTLRDIADALDTAPFRLLAGGVARSRLVRADERPRLAPPNSHVEFELLSHSLEGTFEVVRWVIEPGGANPTAPRGHPGEEAVLILAGHGRLELGNEAFELFAGDFITYDARVPHRMTALGADPLAGVSVLSPPSF
jgi:transcriptional regulator with XRE-family HTH domain